MRIRASAKRQATFVHFLAVLTAPLLLGASCDDDPAPGAGAAGSGAPAGSTGARAGSAGTTGGSAGSKAPGGSAGSKASGGSGADAGAENAGAGGTGGTDASGGAGGNGGSSATGATGGSGGTSNAGTGATSATECGDDQPYAYVSRFLPPWGSSIVDRVRTSGDLVFLGWDGRGVAVVDASDRENPKEIAFIPGLSWQFDVAGDLLLLGINAGVEVIRVSPSGDFERLGFWAPASGSFSDGNIVIAGDRAFISNIAFSLGGAVEIAVLDSSKRPSQRDASSRAGGHGSALSCSARGGNPISDDLDVGRRARPKCHRMSSRRFGPGRAQVADTLGESADTAVASGCRQTWEAGLDLAGNALSARSTRLRSPT